MTIKGTSDLFMANLNWTQAQAVKVQSQITSGLRVQQASDDPSAVATIFRLQGGISANTQAQNNFASVTTELDSANASLSGAITSVESAISAGAAGATTAAIDQTRTSLAQQVAALQESLVSASQTSVNGHYIFSGDQGAQPAFRLDLTQPDGVQQVSSAGATRMIQDPNGTSIAVAKTAQEIFNPRNADGTAATGNAFAAINALRIALQNNDQPGISTAIDALHSADTYLNSQLQFYGAAQNRVTAAGDLSKKFQLQQTAELSQVRDTDVPSAALALTQAQTQQQASLEVLAKISKLSLFDFLT